MMRVGGPPTRNMHGLLCAGVVHVQMYADVVYADVFADGFLFYVLFFSDVIYLLCRVCSCMLG